MAASLLHIKVRGEWQEKEADGEPCACCGDPCFLRLFTYFVRIESLLERGRPIVVAHLCGSCYEVVNPRNIP